VSNPSEWDTGGRAPKGVKPEEGALSVPQIIFVFLI